MPAKYIYLTGAPATGKSSLARAIGGATNAVIFEYGKEMSKHLAKTRAATSQQALRRGTAPYVTPADICAVNELMSSTAAAALATNRHFIADSHQVTAEDFGLSFIPFTAQELQRSRINEVWLLTCSRQSIAKRLRRAREGRRALSPNLQQAHIDIQVQVAVNYSIMAQAQLITLDADQPTSSILENILPRLSLDES